MKLLILTQKVDKNDPVLGFFHRWVEALSKNFESLVVICLEKGEYSLPGNVRVLSLGKEEDKSRLGYLLRFYKYIWQERGGYDAVFVHMNQEYVILGWKLWWLMGKKIYLWRNHAKGSLLTRLSVLFSTKVFYTSPQSFTARFKKAVQMPAGIDTDFFKPDTSVPRIPNSALFLGRISPVKKVLECIEWIKSKGYRATIAGPILEKDKEYGEQVLKVLDDRITYFGPYTPEQERELCWSHEFYVNFTPAGSLDKTIIEAAACGMRLEVTNPDLKNFKVEGHSLKALMSRLKGEIA